MTRIACFVAALLAAAPLSSVSAQDGTIAIPELLMLSPTGLVWKGADADDVAYSFAHAEADISKISQKFWRMPEDSGTMAECGAGPIDFQDFANGVRLHFQDGQFVGWAMGPGARATVLPEGFAIGTTRGMLEVVVDDLDVFESSLGTEFATQDGVYGVLSGPEHSAVIIHLWAGTSCNFR